MRIEPTDVFTPASPAQEDMFAARRYLDLEERVDLALTQRGRQVVLFGDTGVGKTSLVNHLARRRKLAMVRVECGAPFDEMLLEAISRVAPTSETEVTTSSTTTVGGKVSIKIATLKGGNTQTTTSRTEYTARSVQGAAIDALEGARIQVLFLDNFENVGGTKHRADTTRNISQLLKSLADRAENGHNHLKAVVAGIPSASEALINLDDATARRTAQIEVARMPREELDQILARGEEKLKIEFGGTAREMILAYSDGFPYYTHLLALHACRRALADERILVDLTDFDDALDEILADCDLHLRTQYNKAVETSGEVRIRKSILEALASLNSPEVPFREIRKSFLRLHSEYKTLDRLNFLSTAIRPLKEEYKILTDLGKPKSPRNTYRFTNPLMRGYVRLQMRRDGVGQSGFWDPNPQPPPAEDATSKARAGP